MSAQIFKAHKPHEWQVLFTTWLGTLFDGMDASIFAMALFPTLSEILSTKSHSEVGVAASFILASFMIGWAVGSILFGILADRIGRVNTMIFTILLYAICTGLCATAHSVTELIIYRFLVGCGIGGEICVGAVFLAESWKGAARYWATGVMLTAFGFGYLLTAMLNYGLGGFGWRALYLAGLIPAFLTIYIRLRLKESIQFAEVSATSARASRESDDVSLISKEPGSIARALTSIRTLFDRQNLSKTMLVLTLASASIVGYWSVLSWIPAWINQLTGTNAIAERSVCMIVLNIGAILGALVLGGTFDKLGRKKAFFLSYAGALLSCIAMFLTVKSYGIGLLCWAFAVGFFTEAPFVPLFIYVPELFPTEIRVTAFGISVQLGRFFAAAAAILAGQLIALFGGSYPMAGACVALVYIAGMCASLVLPQTKGEVLAIQEPSEVKPILAGAVSAS